MTDVSTPRAPAKPSLAQITQGMLGAPGTTVGGGLYNPTWGSAKDLLQQSKPPAPRSLLTQVWDVIRGAPAGLVHLGGTAAQTFFSPLHLAYDAAFNRDDLADINSIGDFTSQYAPLADELVRSAGQTLGNVIHPSHYLDAIREGDIVGTVLNDVGNIALVGGAVAKGLGAAGSSISAATLRESIATRLAEGTIGEAAARPYLAAADKLETGSGLAGRMSRAGDIERAQQLTRVGNVLRQGAHRLDDIADMPFPAVRWATGKAGDLLAPNVERMVGERLGRAYTIPREGGRIPLSEVMRHAIVGTRAADSRLLSRVTPMGREFADKVSSDLVDRTLRAQTIVSQVGERADTLARENDLPTVRKDPTYQRLTSAAVLDTVGSLEQQLRTWADNYRNAPAGPERDAVLRDVQEQVTRLYEGASASSFIPRPDVVKTLLDERAGLLPDNERVFLEGMRPALRSMYGEAEQMGAQGVGGRVIAPEEMGSEVMSIEVGRQRARLEKQLEANAREMGPARERARSDERLANVYRAVTDAMDDTPDLPGIIARVRSAARQDVNVARAEGMVRVAKERVKQLATELNRAVRMGDSDLDRRVTELKRATQRYDDLRVKEREALAAYEAARSAPPDTPPGGPAGPTSPQTPTPDGGVPPVAPAARAIEPERLDPDRPNRPDRSKPETWVERSDGTWDAGGDFAVDAVTRDRLLLDRQRKEYEARVDSATRTLVEESSRPVIDAAGLLFRQIADGNANGRVIYQPTYLRFMLRFQRLVRQAAIDGTDWLEVALRTVNEATELSPQLREVLAQSIKDLHDASVAGANARQVAIQALPLESRLALGPEVVESIGERSLPEALAKERAIEPTPAPEPQRREPRLLGRSDERGARQSTAVPKERPAPPKISEAAAPARSIEDPDTPRGRLRTARDVYQRVKAKVEERSQRVKAAQEKVNSLREQGRTLSKELAAPDNRGNTGPAAVREAFPQFEAQYRKLLEVQAVAGKVEKLAKDFFAADKKAEKAGSTGLQEQVKTLRALFEYRDEIRRLRTDLGAADGPAERVAGHLDALLRDLDDPTFEAALRGVERDGKAYNMPAGREILKDVASRLVQLDTAKSELFPRGMLTKGQLDDFRRVVNNELPTGTEKEQRSAAKRVMTSAAKGDRGLMVSDVDGELYWTNMYVMGRVSDAPPIAGLNGPGIYDASRDGSGITQRTPDGPPVKPLLEGVGKADIELSIERVRAPLADTGDALLLVLRDADGREYHVNEDYFGTVYRDGDRLVSAGELKPVYVLRDGKTVGMVMPIRVSGIDGGIGKFTDGLAGTGGYGTRAFGMEHPAIARLLQAEQGVNSPEIERQIAANREATTKAEAELRDAEAAAKDREATKEFEDAERGVNRTLLETANDEVRSSRLLNDAYAYFNEQQLRSRHDDAINELNRMRPIVEGAKPSMKLDELRRRLYEAAGTWGATQGLRSKDSMIAALRRRLKDAEGEAAVAKERLDAGITPGNERIDAVDFISNATAGRYSSFYVDPKAGAEFLAEANRVQDILLGNEPPVGLRRNDAVLVKMTAADKSTSWVTTTVYNVLNDGRVFEVADPRREGASLRVIAEDIRPATGDVTPTPAVEATPARPAPKISRAAEPATAGRRTTDIPRRQPDAPAPKLADTATPTPERVDYYNRALGEWDQALSELADMRERAARGDLTIAEFSDRTGGTSVDAARFAMNGTAGKSMPSKLADRIDYVERMVRAARERSVTQAGQEGIDLGAPTPTPPAPNLTDTATVDVADEAPADLRSTVVDVVEAVINGWVGPLAERDGLRRALSPIRESPARFDEALPAMREQLVAAMRATPNAKLGDALWVLVDRVDKHLAAAPKLAEAAKPVRTAQRHMPDVRVGMPRPELVKELGIEVPVAWRDTKTVDQGPAIWKGDTPPLRDSFYDGLYVTRRSQPVYTAPLRTLEEVKTELDGQKPIVCIACGESKLDRAAPAGELYTSDAFKKNLEAALALVDGDRSRVFVISAKHGYLPLDEVIDPYEASFKQRERTVNRKDYVTTPNIMRMQATSLPDGPTVVLGGKDYTGAVIATIGDRPVVPVFNGTKGIGEQKQIAGSIAAGAKRPEAPAPKLADVGAATPPPPEPPTAPEAAAGGGEPPRPGVAAAKTALDEARGQRKEAKKVEQQAKGRVAAADRRDQALRAERDPEFKLAGRYPQERRTSPHAEQGFVDPDTDVGALRDEVSPELAAIDKKATGQELTSRVEKAAQKVVEAEQTVEVRKRSAQASKVFADLTDDEKAAYNAHRRRRDREGRVKSMSKAERINRRLGAAEEQARVSAAKLKQIEDRQNLTMREIADLPVTIARPVQARMRDLVHGRSKSLSLNDQGPKGPIKLDDWIELPNGRWGRVTEVVESEVRDKAGKVVVDAATGKPATEFAGWSVDMGGGKIETVMPGEGWRWRSNKGGSIGSLRNQLRRVAPPLGEARTVEIDQWKGLSGDEKRDLADAGEEQFRTELRGSGPIYDTIVQAAKRGDYNPIDVVEQIEALTTDRARVTWLGEHADELGLTPKDMEGLLHSLEIDERLVQFEMRVGESHADGSWMDLPIELGRMTEDLGWAPQEYHNVRNLTVHRYKDARVRSLADDALNVAAMPARWRPTAMMARRQIKVMLDEAERLRGEGLDDAARYQLSLAAEVATNIRDLADMGIDPIYVTGGPPAPMGQAVDSLRPRPNRSDYQRKTPYTVLNLDEAQATQLSVMVQRHRNETYRRAEETFGKTLSEIPELHDWLRGFVDENNRYPTSDEFIEAAKAQGWSLIDRGKGLGRTKNVNLAAQLDEELKLANEIHDTAIAAGDEARIQRTRFELEEAQRRRDRAVAVTPKSLRDAWSAYDRARNDLDRLTAQDSTTGPYPFGVDPDAVAAAEQRMRQAAAVLAEAEAASMPMLVPDAIAVEMARDATLWDRGMLPGFRTLAKSNRFFKNQVLPLSVRWYINNSLGNVLMAAAFGGIGPRALFQQIRTLRSDFGLTGAGRKSQDAIESGLLGGKLDVGNVRGARIQQSGLLESQRRGLGLAEFDQAAEARTRAGRALRAVTDRGYGINEFMDNVYRSSVYLAKIEKYIVKGARSDIDVVTPAGVQRVAEAALKDTLKAMGDYTNMAPWQRKYLRQIFPWWSWIRHSTIAAMRLPIEHPVRALWLGQLSELANEDDLSGDELAFFGGRWMLGDGRSIPIASLSPLEDPLQNPIFNPPGLIRGIAPLIKIGTVAATGLDLGRISQVTQPPANVKRGAFGQQVADPLIYDPMALAGYAVGQFPMLKNLRDVLEGPAVRYGTGEAIVDRKGNPIPSGKSRAGSLAAIFGIPWPEDVTPQGAAQRKKERITLGQ